jgi:hypothetical protein
VPAGSFWTKLARPGGILVLMQPVMPNSSSCGSGNGRGIVYARHEVPVLMRLLPGCPKGGAVLHGCSRFLYQSVSLLTRLVDNITVVIVVPNFTLVKI